MFARLVSVSERLATQHAFGIAGSVQSVNAAVAADIMGKSRCYCHSQQNAANFSSTSEEQAKPYKILGVQQIAIGCVERESLDKLWKDVFGLKPHDTVTIEKENVIEDIVQLGPSPYTVEIDLMTPFDSMKSPKVHVPPLNHIGLWVDNLPAAVTYMTQVAKVRFTPGGIRRGAAGHDVIFIHPKGNEEFPISGNGVLIELVQAPQDVIDAYTSTKK
jgi:lactoylglutathione lyase